MAVKVSSYVRRGRGGRAIRVGGYKRGLPAGFKSDTMRAMKQTTGWKKDYQRKNLAAATRAAALDRRGSRPSLRASTKINKRVNANRSIYNGPRRNSRTVSPRGNVAKKRGGRL